MALNEHRIVVVMPAYNAALTLKQTLDEMPMDIVDEVILVDDKSADDTVNVARELGLRTIAHEANRGYGGNQKTCYDAALEYNPDIVAMIHPDYQYTPRILRATCCLIAEANYEFVLGSRVLTGGALRGGMPKYKYVANRFLTLFQNLCLGNKLSEYHTGYRVYDARILREIDYHQFSEDFVFDNQMLTEIILRNYNIGEVSCPTRYFEAASSISFRRSCIYGLGVLGASLRGLISRMSGHRSLLPRAAERTDS